MLLFYLLGDKKVFDGYNAYCLVSNYFISISYLTFLFAFESLCLVLHLLQLLFLFVCVFFFYMEVMFYMKRSIITCICGIGLKNLCPSVDFKLLTGFLRCSSVSGVYTFMFRVSVVWGFVGELGNVIVFIIGYEEKGVGGGYGYGQVSNISFEGGLGLGNLLLFLVLFFWGGKSQFLPLRYSIDVYAKFLQHIKWCLNCVCSSVTK